MDIEARLATIEQRRKALAAEKAKLEAKKEVSVEQLRAYLKTLKERGYSSLSEARAAGEKMKADIDAKVKEIEDILDGR